jgi:hypothetical protein
MTGRLPPISSFSGAKPFEDHEQRLFFFKLNTCGHTPYVTSSLTRGWVCVLWVGFAFVKCTYRTFSILLKILPCALYTSPLVTPGFAKQFMSILHILCFNGNLKSFELPWASPPLSLSLLYFLHLAVPKPYAVNMFILVHLLLVTCTIFLYNRIHTEGWMLCANCGPMCSLQNFKWWRRTLFCMRSKIKG